MSAPSPRNRKLNGSTTVRIAAAPGFRGEPSVRTTFEADSACDTVRPVIAWESQK